MIEKYVTEGGLYLITNKAVARTSIFADQHYCERFLYQLRRYVGPLGEILGYSLIDDEFCFVIRLSKKATFENYHAQRQVYEGKTPGEIPASTYIFSQALANLQSSTAKHFNFREDRSGTLFASRFKKMKILDHDHLLRVLQQLWQGVQEKIYKRRWRDPSFDRVLKRTSWFYNFRGLLAKGMDLAFLREVGMVLGRRIVIWMAGIKDELQGRLKETYFFHKIPFHLPFLKPPNPP